MAVILGIAIAISSLLVWLSVHPGLSTELAVLALIGSPFWVPAVCISSFLYWDMIHQVPDYRVPTEARLWRRVIVALLLLALLLNGGLLWGGLARRVAFRRARPAFEALVARAQAASARGEPVERRLGVYDVDQIAADPRGGLYFRTRCRSDGFSARHLSYGFSLRPNRAGSPFGDVDYTLSHLVDDWYCFRASEP